MTQPTALSLARQLGDIPWTLEHAADELRRLHSINTELLEALKYHQEQTRPIERTYVVIAKAEGQA
jgi:hypothetical protein